MKMEKWTFNAVFPSFFLSFSSFFFFSFLFIFDRFFKLLLSKFVIREISLFAQLFKVTSRNGYRLNNKAFFLFFFFFKVSFNQKYHVHVINICSLWKISSKKFKEKIKICRIESFHKIKIKSRFAKIFSKTSRLFLNYARNKLQFEQRNRFNLSSILLINKSLPGMGDRWTSRLRWICKPVSWRQRAASASTGIVGRPPFTLARTSRSSIA